MARKKSAGSRPARLGEQIRQELSEMFQAGMVRDPRFGSAMVTVTEVEVSGDLQHARAFVSVFPETPEVRDGVMDALDLAKRSLRRELGSRLTVRHLPELHFGYDGSAITGRRIEDLLAEIRKEEPGPPADPPADPDER